VTGRLTLGHSGGPFPNLDGFRAVGCLMVMANHVAFAANMYDKHPEINRFLARFDISIPLFFLVSGFLLFRPFASSLLTQRSWPRLGDYASNRAWRILPAYWAAMATAMIWFGVPTVSGAGVFDQHPFGSIAFYSLLLQTFSAQSVFQGFGEFDQAWSIGTEITFYAALPLVALAWRRAGRDLDPLARRRLILWSCAGIWIGAQVWRAWLASSEASWAPSAAFWLPAHMDFFAIGMAMAALSVGHGIGLPLPRWIGYLGDRPWASWMIAGAIWLVVVNPGGITELFEIRRNPLDFSREYVAKQLLYGIIGGFAVLPAVFGDQHTGLIRRFLGHRVMVALGAISLGTYLWHKCWLTQAEIWTGAEPFQAPFLITLAITVAGGLASGALCHLLIERPVMERKRRRSLDRSAKVGVP